VLFTEDAGTAKGAGESCSCCGWPTSMVAVGVADVGATFIVDAASASAPEAAAAAPDSLFVFCEVKKQPIDQSLVLTR